MSNFESLEMDRNEEREKFLHSELSPYLRDVKWFSAIDSSNDFAKRWMNDDPSAQLPALIVADQQMNGRGRGVHRWWSPEGCLMFTLVWRPKDRAAIQQRLPQLALVVGLSIATALDRFSELSCQIKWPNDIYLAEKKIAGILVESVSSSAWAIGVGINVQVPIHEATEPDVRERATSLHYWSVSKMDREVILVEVIRCMSNDLDEWQSDGGNLLENWAPRCFLNDRLIEVDSAQATIVGRCRSINSEGYLQVQDSQGRLHSVRAGSIRIIG